jgi:threonine/homoserine/homoserine lactone efflux protein
MLSWHAYLLYCGVYAIAVAVPGPGVMAIIARVLGSGFRSALPAVAGTVVGDWFLMTLSAFGLAMVARAMGGLFLIVKLAGAAYLIYLAYRHWTAKVDVENELVAPATARDGFLSQLFLTIGNPKAIAFFVALLPTVVDLHALRLPGYLQLASVTVLMIPSVLLTYAAVASRFSGLVTSAKARKTINRTAAVVLAGAGVGVAVS